MLKLEALAVGEGATRALAPLSLQLSAGNLLAVIGPAEAGKSVLLKAIAGLLPDASGQVALAGCERDVATRDGLASWQRLIGMAFQNDALFDDLTVFENVAFPLRRRDVASVEIDARVTSLLGRVGLAESAALLPHALSGGMRKRVGIARAVVVQPALALFDEPLAGLDPVSAARIVALIVELCRTLNVPAVLVSNDLPVVLPVADRVLLLKGGRVLYDGAPCGLATAPSAYVRAFVSGREPPESDDASE